MVEPASSIEAKLVVNTDGAPFSSSCVHFGTQFIEARVAGLQNMIGA